MKAKIKKGDTVLVTAGRERGKTGKVLRVALDEGRIWVERLNMVKRHRKPQGGRSAGGIQEKEAPLHISNVRLLSERLGKPVRVGRKRLEDGRRVRFSHKHGEQIDP